MIHHYYVMTPLFTTQYGDDPPETERDVVTVFADSPSTAKILAIRSKEFKTWVQMQRSDQVSPFTGLIVEEAKCPHGKCNCDICNQECVICEKEALSHG